MTWALSALLICGLGLAVAVLLVVLTWRRERPTERHYGGCTRSPYWERHSRESGR